jgi:hypothetical protein
MKGRKPQSKVGEEEAECVREEKETGVEVLKEEER